MKNLEKQETIIKAENDAIQAFNELLAVSPQVSVKELFEYAKKDISIAKIIIKKMECLLESVFLRRFFKKNNKSL